MRYLFAATTLFCLLACRFAAANSPGPSANPYRAYPPSCLADPLPATPTGPSWSKTLNVAAVLANGSTASEDITLTFWRSPCSGGNAALLGVFQRAPQNVGRTDLLPQFPGIFIQVSDTATAFVRIGVEPNTVRSDFFSGTLLTENVPFVLENYLPSGADFFTGTDSFNFSSALRLIFTTGFDPGNAPLPSLDIPAYNATLYSDSLLRMPVSGYLTGNWFDAQHSGEGIQTEVGELGGSGNNRFLSVAWYTYDSLGFPYWLFGSGVFSAGDSVVNVDLAYGSGGSFAGNGPSASFAAWGPMQVDFPDCNTMRFTFQSLGGLPSAVPQGGGTRVWSRLTQMNGLTCE